MNVKNPDLVIVRGINSDWFKENFSQLWVGFGGTPQATPKEDAYYVGLYLEAPTSAITHIGIVERIERSKDIANFYLKGIIKLKSPIKPGHAIRKHENWSLKDFNLNKIEIENLRQQINII